MENALVCELRFSQIDLSRVVLGRILRVSKMGMLLPCVILSPGPQFRCAPVDPFTQVPLADRRSRIVNVISILRILSWPVAGWECRSQRPSKA
jgi:hypothetical protein